MDTIPVLVAITLTLNQLAVMHSLTRGKDDISISTADKCVTSSALHWTEEASNSDTARFRVTPCDLPVRYW